MATRPLAAISSRYFRRLSAMATSPSGGSSAKPLAGSMPPPSAAAASSPVSSAAAGSSPSSSNASRVGDPAGASGASSATAAPPSGAAAAAADAPLPSPDVHSTGLGLDPTIDPASVDPLRYRKAAWKYGGALLLFLPAYTYLTQFAIPEAEARKAVRRANAKAAEEEVEAAKAKAAEGRVVAPVLPRSMRSSWAGESPVAVRDGVVPGAAEGLDGEALMAATARQQAEAQEAWERQRRLQAAGGEEPPPAAGAADPPLLPGLGSAPLRGATDEPAHQMFPGVKEDPDGTVSAADELALREVELAVKLKKLRSLPPSADVETERTALLSEVEAVTAEMRALGSPPPATASSS